jgi:hypothetical protein
MMLPFCCARCVAAEFLARAQTGDEGEAKAEIAHDDFA